MQYNAPLIKGFIGPRMAQKSMTLVHYQVMISS